MANIILALLFGNKNSNYLLNNQITNQKWAQINYPFLMKVSNEYRIYYSATPSGYTVEICMAQSFNL